MSIRLKLIKFLTNISTFQVSVKRACKCCGVCDTGQNGLLLSSKDFWCPPNNLEKKSEGDSKENASAAIKIQVQLVPKFPIFSKDEEKELSAYELDKENRLTG